MTTMPTSGILKKNLYKRFLSAMDLNHVMLPVALTALRVSRTVEGFKSQFIIFLFKIFINLPSYAQ